MKKSLMIMMTLAVSVLLISVVAAWSWPFTGKVTSGRGNSVGRTINWDLFLDSDGGRDYEEAGIVVYPSWGVWRWGSDRCVSNTKLKEYYVFGDGENKRKSFLYRTCTNGCEEVTATLNHEGFDSTISTTNAGRCIASSEEEPETPTTGTLSCTEDGHLVTYVDSSGRTRYARDACSGNDLLDYSCNPEATYSTVYDVAKLDANGEVISGKDQKVDQADLIYIESQFSAASSEYTEIRNYLLRNPKDGTQIVQSTIECPAGCNIALRRCRQEPSPRCYDTDASDNTKKGVTRSGIYIGVDKCVGENKVLEFSCASSTSAFVSAQVVDCLSGKTCRAGACTTQ